MTDAAATLPAGQKTAAAGAPALPFKLILIALCMAQFINAYDTTAMNVAVTSVVKSLGTTVSGVQSALVLYSLIMAAFMLIGGKLGDIWGRRSGAAGVRVSHDLRLALLFRHGGLRRQQQRDDDDADLHDERVAPAGVGREKPAHQRPQSGAHGGHGSCGGEGADAHLPCLLYT